MKKEISVIVPVFNAEDTLDDLFSSLRENLKKITNNYEIIFVDDESKDSSWSVIKKISKHNDFVKGLKFARNCGVDIAINAGLEISKGQYNIIISCDLQDPTREIQSLYRKIKEENFDVVCSYYKNKHPESIVENFFLDCIGKYFLFLQMQITLKKKVYIGLFLLEQNYFF